MATIDELHLAFEIHSEEKLRDGLTGGYDAAEPIEGMPLFECLTSSYMRSGRFAACARILAEAGAPCEPVLQALLTDEAARLDALLDAEPARVHAPITLVSAFTPLDDASPLHICAEFNLCESARVLLARGADVNAPAGADAEGLGGQTPIFHAVNSLGNTCRPMMELLVEAGADLDLTVKGLRWGRNQEWETYVPEVNPVSYAMIGNLRQFQRDEAVIRANIDFLQQRKYGASIPVANIPNAYLARRRKMQEEHICKVLDW